jgi:hypothetical protein
VSEAGKPALGGSPRAACQGMPWPNNVLPRPNSPGLSAGAFLLGMINFVRCYRRVPMRHAMSQYSLVRPANFAR